MKTRSIKIVLSVSALMFAWNTSASVTDAANDIISALGVRAAQEATQTCDVDNMIKNYGPGDGGRLSAINVIPCVINKIGLPAGGITGSGGLTKSITLSGNTINVHFIVGPGPISVDGKTYDYEVKIWACSGTCDSVSAYYPLAYMAFSSNNAGTINKGVMALNSNAQSGSIAESQFVRWDTGSATATKTIDNIDAECGSEIRTYAYTRVGDEAKSSVISVTASTAQGSAESWNWSGNDGVYGSDTSVTPGAAPSLVGGFTRTASTYDFTYTAGGSSTATLLNYPSFLSVATMQGSDYVGIDCNTIKTSGFPKVVTGVGILSTPITAMGGMGTHPDNL